MAHKYTPKGTFTAIDDMNLYTSGSGEKGVVIVYDIFGFDYKQV
jgi:hypothetical protein